MTTRFIRPSDANTFVTSFLDFDFDENATCPLWFSFLDFLTCGNEEIIVTLRQWLGTILLPSIRHEKFLWLYGVGDNGKSVFADVISRVLGPQIVAHLTVEQLCGNHELAGLANKRLNIAMEFEKLSYRIEAAIKRLVSNETIAVNEKYKPVYFAKLAIRLMFGSNSVPYVSDRSEGFWRRCILVACLAKVAPEQRDLDLANKLVEQESAGIFNWILEGAVEVTAAGGKIFIADAVNAAVNRQRDTMDPHRVFVEEEIVAADNSFWLPGVQTIYPRYCEWMEARGHSGKLTWSRFREVLEQIHPQAEPAQRREPFVGKCRGYSGLRWKNETEQFEETT